MFFLKIDTFLIIMIRILQRFLWCMLFPVKWCVENIWKYYLLYYQLKGSYEDIAVANDGLIQIEFEHQIGKINVHIQFYLNFKMIKLMKAFY